ncbi:MAG: hypothetical protein COY40_06225 [Alphaproteobacteria bacterium CG_4_10_14_0_8_um_filter_53_9]|nr:MAG: hypothetical protein COY40_06225 [Alphaproteobacteria bacterium CG_4_10_14_0_8_um_filter_53_9]
MNKTLLATTALAFVAATASAVDVELYGQVNKGVFAFDDGADTNFVVVDNDMSSSRFGLKGAQALDNGLTASVLYEAEMQGNPSNNFSKDFTAANNQVTDGAAATMTERQARVGMSGNFGGVYVGRQSTAIDGVIGQDLAGVGDVMNSENSDIGGGIQFATSTGAASGVTVGGSTFGLPSRSNSVRYDSPIVAGFQGRAAIAQGGDMDASVFYEGGMNDFTVAAAAGVHMNNDSNQNVANRVDTEVAASVSAKHTSGIAGTVAYTTQSLGNKAAAVEEPSAWYAKVGYAWDAYEVAADYGVSKDYNNVGTRSDDLTTMGLGAQYNLGNGISLAALYRNFDLDRTALTTEDVSLYGVNMRVKF